MRLEDFAQRRLAGEPVARIIGFKEFWGLPFFVDPDRRTAIRAAIAEAVPGDVVVIAGKGHEDYQILGTTKIHFDDREEAIAAVKLRESRSLAQLANEAGFPHRGRIDFQRISDPRARYNSMAAYAQSKLANVRHAFALARRYSGTRVCVNCLHPGVVATNLLPAWLRVVKPLISRVVFDAERGARTSLYLALSNEVAGISGRYFDENQLPQPAATLANDLQLQESLWQASARWVGVAP